MHSVVPAVANEAFLQNWWYLGLDVCWVSPCEGVRQRTGPCGRSNRVRRLDRANSVHLRPGFGEPPLNYPVPRSLQDSRRCISQRVIALKDEGTHPRFLPRAGRTFACPTPRSTRSMGPAESHFALHLHSLHPPRPPIITVQITLWSALGNRFQHARPTFNLDIDGTAFIDILLLVLLPSFRIPLGASSSWNMHGISPQALTVIL